MDKNELYRVTIEDMTENGEGIGHAEGCTLFVKDAVIGDEIVARITRPKKTFAYARLEELLTPSQDRVEARCPVAKRCGGCSLQALSYEKQLSFKENKIRRNLERIGGFTDVPMEPIMGMEEPWRYRNKAQYPIGWDAKQKKIVAGYYAARSHDIIDIRDCALSPEHNARILEAVVSFAEEFHVRPYDETTGKGLLRHLLIREGFISGQILVCLVINGETLPKAEQLVKRLLAVKLDESEGRKPYIASVCLNINKKQTNVILGDRVKALYGEPWITDSLDGHEFRISPLSFYQVNPIQTVRLYGTAVEFAGLTGKEVVYDLFCGIGTISQFMADKAKEVYGVEIVPQAIEDAKANAARNGLTNTHFYAAAAEDIADRGYFDADTPLVHPDVVVLDPPRKGCEESLLRVIRRLGPDRVVYVSCDSATLARDLKLLCAPGVPGSEAGYKLERVRGCDMFGQTTHIETIVLLQKLNS